MLQGGVNLTLMIGPAVPIPVPRVVLEALTELKVMVNPDGPSGFELQFKLSNDSPLHTIFMLSGGAMIPIIRVIIVVTVNGMPEVLMDGVMTHHQVSPGQNGQAVLTVQGKDLTALMDWIPLDGVPYPAMPPSARVLVILAKYAAFGVIPAVIPSVLLDAPIPTDRIPRQQGTDYEYIRQLADEVGYVFHLTPGPAPGISTAYWGPEIKVGVPQPALNLDMDMFSNVESLNFSFDTENAKIPIVMIQNQATKAPIPIPIPDITPLNPPLGLIPPIPQGYEVIDETAKYSPVRAALIGLAKAAKSADAVTASGSLDVVRYGRVLKARQLVGVRGAGMAFDGLYYVTGVTSTIKRGEFKQSFNLSRNGLVSTVPNVPV